MKSKIFNSDVFKPKLIFRSVLFPKCFRAPSTTTLSSSLVRTFQVTCNIKILLIGTHGINWVTEDCGSKLRGLNSGKKIHEFQFHPTEKQWALAATWTDCSEFGDDPCKIYKELYATKDLGGTW